jgi:hypothetical protein
VGLGLPLADAKSDRPLYFRRVVHRLHPRDFRRRKAAPLSVFADDILVSCDTYAEGVVVADVGVLPFYIRPKWTRKIHMYSEKIIHDNMKVPRFKAKAVNK